MWLFKGDGGRGGTFAPKRYKVCGRPTASGGVEMTLTVFEALDTKASGGDARCAVVVLEKNTLAKRLTNGAAREATLQLARDAIKRIAGFKHPYVLAVRELIPESRSALAFVSEPVELSLANASNKDFFGLENDDISDSARSYELCEFQVACGLLQVSRALAFLHLNQMVHGNIGPRSIFITPSGQWKLGGFEFLQKKAAGDTCTCECLSNLPPYQPVPIFPPAPSPLHAAPEILCQPHRYGPPADVWALGALAAEVFSGGKPLLQGGGSEARARRTLQDWHGLATAVHSVPDGAFVRASNTLPQFARVTIARMLAVEPSDRPTASQLLESPMLAGPTSPLSILRDIEAAFDSERGQQRSSPLDASLTERVTLLPLKVVQQQILPIVTSALLRDVESCFLSVPLLLSISRTLAPDVFTALVEPSLARFIAESIKSSGPRLVLLAKYLGQVARIGTVGFVESHVVPLIGACLESTNPQVLQHILAELPSALMHLKNVSAGRAESIVASSSLPRLHKLLSSPATSLPIRLAGLAVVEKLLRSNENLIGAELLAPHVFPMLRESVKIDRSAPVILAVFAVLHACVDISSASQIGRNILPMMCSLIAEEDIDHNQVFSLVERTQRTLTLLGSKRMETAKSAKATPLRPDMNDSFGAPTSLSSSTSSNVSWLPESSGSLRISESSFARPLQPAEELHDHYVGHHSLLPPSEPQYTATFSQPIGRAGSYPGQESLFASGFIPGGMPMTSSGLSTSVRHQPASQSVIMQPIVSFDPIASSKEAQGDSTFDFFS